MALLRSIFKATVNIVLILWSPLKREEENGSQYRERRASARGQLATNIKQLQGNSVKINVSILTALFV